jgi:hypothetical protein
VTIGIEPIELVKLYPRLYHMAADGSWPSIARNGLLSTSALLDLFEVEDDTRHPLEARRRPDSVEITHATYGTATIRDQKPMSDASVRKAIAGTGLSPEDWYRLLNERVFFWLTPERLHRMLNARPYRNNVHVVLTVDTKALVTNNLPNVSLSPINRGATLPYPHPRGPSTFRSLADYPFGELMRRRRGQDAVVELAVAYSVPRISEYVIEVCRMRGPHVLNRLEP